MDTGLLKNNSKIPNQKLLGTCVECSLCAEDSKTQGLLDGSLFETVSAQQGLGLSETSISSLWVKGFDRAIETLGKDLGFIVFCFEKNNFIYLYFWLFWIFICPMGYYLRCSNGGSLLLQCVGFSL